LGVFKASPNTREINTCALRVNENSTRKERILILVSVFIFLRFEYIALAELNSNSARAT
jgi:hypothetical protein